jgi:hypothetical protein
MKVSTLVTALKNREDVKMFLFDLIRDCSDAHQATEFVAWAMSKGVAFLRLLVLHGFSPILTDGELESLADHCRTPNGFLAATILLAERTRKLPLGAKMRAYERAIQFCPQPAPKGTVVVAPVADPLRDRRIIEVNR